MQKKIKVQFHTVRADKAGYGSVKRMILDSIEKSEILELVDNNADVEFYCQPPASPVENTKTPKVLYTFHESTQLNDNIKEGLKQYDYVIHPTKWQADVFISKNVLPLYIEEFWSGESSNDTDEVVFIHYNAWTFRKNTENLLEAFLNEFKDDEKARLIIKGTSVSNSVLIHETDKNNNGLKVTEIYDALSEEELKELTLTADAFVFPALGEGWGLPPFQAQAMGLTAIIPEHSGFSEWANKHNIILKSDGFIKAPSHHGGAMWHISVKEIQKALRMYYNNKTKYKADCKKSIEYIKKNFKQEGFIKGLEGFILEVLK